MVTRGGTQMEYTIRKGQQYDRDGAVVMYGDLYVTYDHVGQRHTGGVVPAWARDQVEAVVRRVIATGVDETISVARPGTVQRTPPVASIDCPHWTPEQGCPLHGETCNPAYR